MPTNVIKNTGQAVHSETNQLSEVLHTYPMLCSVETNVGDPYCISIVVHSLAYIDHLAQTLPNVFNGNTSCNLSRMAHDPSHLMERTSPPNEDLSFSKIQYTVHMLRNFFLPTFAILSSNVCPVVFSPVSNHSTYEHYPN